MNRIAIAGACLATAVVVVAAVDAGVLGGNRGSVAASASNASLAPTVPTTMTRRGDLPQTVAATGRIGMPGGGDTKLAFALPGILDRVSVVPGERVVAGQTLATLDRRGLAATLAQARADAAAADASYAGGATALAAAAAARAKVDAAREHVNALDSGGPAASGDRVAAEVVARQAALKVESDRSAFARATALYVGGVTARRDVEAARILLASDLADLHGADAKVAAAVATSGSALRAARADLAQARSDLAAANAGIGTAAAQRASASARLASSETDFARGSIVAPADAVIASVLKHSGEAVDPSTPVLDVVAPQNDNATLTVPGIEAMRVRAGDAATVRFASGVRVRATVATVVPDVDPVTQAATVVLRGRFPDGTGGLAVSTSIVVARVRGAIVPASAVVTDPQTGATVVFVRDRTSSDAPFAARRVEVLADDGSSAIVSGIGLGVEIARTAGYDLLAPSGS